MSQLPTDYVEAGADRLVEDALRTGTVHANDEYTTVDILRDNAEIHSRLPRAFADASGQLS